MRVSLEVVGLHATPRLLDDKVAVPAGDLLVKGNAGCQFWSRREVRLGKESWQIRTDR